MDDFERARRAYVAVTILESIHRQLEQIYNESAKGVGADIITDLGDARRAVEKAQKRQLRHYDAMIAKMRSSSTAGRKP